jgi:ribosomal protein L34
MARRTLPRLPQLLDRKIYKTGQTRGADDDEIYQNRVSRNSTVLIPYPVWIRHFTPAEWARHFKKGYIVLISPTEYFDRLQNGTALADSGLELGRNALVFFETRTSWLEHDPAAINWVPAESRLAPLRGQYVARISATTASDNGAKIIRGFDTTANKGAGIRVYEYANDEAIDHCRFQLEALFWLCIDAEVVAVANRMTEENATLRKREILKLCEQHRLLDYTRLEEVRILNRSRRTICPLCLKELSSQGFFSRMEQAEGREVLDLTITQLNLFHIDELRMGAFNHRPYNLGWGHHHCNIVVKDSGIAKTLEWMRDVVERNTTL